MEKKRITVGGVTLGDGHIYIQSMLNKPPQDIKGNIKQATELEKCGCEIIRAAVPDMESVKLIDALKSHIKIPIVADIHFDYKLAVESVYAGADKIRINPGNIGGEDRIREVVKACELKNVPIRVGVNSGSIQHDLLDKYGNTAEALVQSAVLNIQTLEKHDFSDIVVSIKSSDVKKTIEGYRKLAEVCNYPLHIGVTEAGTERMGLIKSAIGIGSLLSDGIGDTIRVSLTGDPVLEVTAANDILKAIGLKKGVMVISCPTCGRTKIDLIKLTAEVEDAVKGIGKDIKIAVMGCAVNGPGEARDADIGIAGGSGEGILFKKGQILRKVSEERLLDELLFEIKNF